MSLIGPDHHSINQENPELQRTGNKLGQSWEGAEGTLGEKPFRQTLPLTLPQRITVTVRFAGNTKS